jgi:hypothetical protein
VSKSGIDIFGTTQAGRLPVVGCNVAALVMGRGSIDAPAGLADRVSTVGSGTSMPRFWAAI